MTARETSEVPVLSEDIRVGDVLLDAEFGGAWGREVTGVQTYPDGVRVWMGVESAWLLRAERVTVRRVVKAEGVDPLIKEILGQFGMR